MKFEYQALDSHGKLVRGVEEANNFKEFIAILFHKKLRPFDVRRVSGAGQKAHDDLDHLKKLKKRIEGTSDEIELPNIELNPKAKWQMPQIDYAYLLYLIVIIGLIIAAAYNLKIT